MGNHNVLENYNVLIVDDKKLIRTILKSHITEFGYEVFTAKNGKEALEIIDESERIDVIIIDIITGMNMPEMNGLNQMDGLGFIREVHERYNIPILVMGTGCSNRIKKEAVDYANMIAASRGIRDLNPLLENPFQTEELEKKVNQALRLYEK